MNRADMLAAYLAEVWGRPYQIGQWDCVLFVAEWADRLMAQATGGDRLPDFATQLRGAYTSEREGIALFTSGTGLNPAIGTALNVHDWIPCEILTLEPGDIVLTDLHHPGIWDGRAIVAQAARSTGVVHFHVSHGALGMQPPA